MSYPQNPPQYPQDPQYGQQQYAQPQYPQYTQYQQFQQNKPARPDNYLVWSILVTLFCCLPLGIVAIVRSIQVDILYSNGDYQGAQKASDDAKKYCIISAVIPAVICVFYLIIGLLPLLFI